MRFERAKPLTTSGVLSQSVYEQRESAARTAESQLVSARDGLKLAQAERAQIEASRRELSWKTVEHRGPARQPTAWSAAAMRASVQSPQEQLILCSV